jgi:ribosome maturation factor RimP
MTMEKELIIKSIGPAVEQRGCFIVEVTVSKDNDVVLAIEKEVGDVDLEDCVSINDTFLSIFDKDAEDYSLTVTSAGLDQPFKVPGQYKKAIGSQVVVLLRGGAKIVGVLTEADEEGITLRYSRKETVEGKKKKVTVEHEEKFGFEEINSVKSHVEFKK